MNLKTHRFRNYAMITKCIDILVCLAMLCQLLISYSWKSYLYTNKM